MESFPGFQINLEKRTGCIFHIQFRAQNKFTPGRHYLIELVFIIKIKLIHPEACIEKPFPHTKIFIEISIERILIYITQFQVIKYFKFVIDMRQFAVIYFINLKSQSER